jgi:hypothetical protein
VKCVWVGCHRVGGWCSYVCLWICFDEGCVNAIAAVDCSDYLEGGWVRGQREATSKDILIIFIGE